MTLFIIGILIFAALTTATIFCAYTFLTTPSHDGEIRIMALIFGFFLLIGALSMFAVLIGEVTVGPSIPDGCYRIYNESDTSFIPTGNGTISPIVSNERHYLPIRCP